MALLARLTQKWVYTVLRLLSTIMIIFMVVKPNKELDEIVIMKVMKQ